MATRKQIITEAARKRRQRVEVFMQDVSLLAIIRASEYVAKGPQRYEPTRVEGGPR